MKKACPRFHGILLPDAGHYPTIENPEGFNHAVMDFLAGVRLYG
jgi:pimeloyl-ACP methyl ester carboxylesterase